MLRLLAHLLEELFVDVGREVADVQVGGVRVRVAERARVHVVRVGRQAQVAQLPLPRLTLLLLPAGRRSQSMVSLHAQHPLNVAPQLLGCCRAAYGNA